MTAQTQATAAGRPSSESNGSPESNGSVDVDVVVVGAGFAGVRTLIELRRLGLSATVIEAGTDVGGTWYWNRYPGARTDSESWSYCFPFPELEQEWDWAERYPTQPEVQRYLRLVVERFDLRDDIEFGQRVSSAEYDEARDSWTVTTESGGRYTCRYFITALGHLSVPYEPAVPGTETFTGETYLTSRWPKGEVDFTGKRVGVIGTGASAIQAIPVIAEQAAQLTVFQRTPNYVMPAQNHRLTDEQRQQIKDDYPRIWEQARRHVFGFPMDPAGRVYDDVTDQEREKIFEQGWADGGFHYVFETFDDIILDERSNEAAAEFIRAKIRETVIDPATAELLCPKDYPYVAKRPPAGHGYYETFNRDNVRLVDLNADPIVEVVPSGIRTQDTRHDFDVLVFATGFDAVTGPFNKIDIRGRGGRRLTEKWSDGPVTQLGIGVPGFPNLFMVCGPQSAYANIPVVIEEVVGWIGRALGAASDRGASAVEALDDAATAWGEHVEQVFGATLLPRGEKVGSWYLGANIPGKKRRVLFYFAGAGAYFDQLDLAERAGFSGFAFTEGGSRG
ncbi:MAG TPA: NAD(P)/FAD-dependent oxidoreductase [Pseudonocardia sp.]|jgi:cyclohexanone monooxygenase|nr:NAD(P)/FAD-dependent oxidoreductase [Pseudonocardia sp.]